MNQDAQPIKLPGQLGSGVQWRGRTAFGHAVVMRNGHELYGCQITTSARRNADVTRVSNGSRTATKVVKNLSVEAGRRHESHRPHVCEMLSKSQFLKQLQLEKRRVERSRAPLSIVLFHLEHENRDDLRDVKALFNILRNNKREGDIAGDLDDDLVAIVLPETNAQGAQAFAQKITKQLDDLPCTASTATYPDHLFENLTMGSEDTLNPNPTLDDYTDYTSCGYLLKRCVDVTGAIVAIFLFAPLMLITALAIKITSPGPVIFKQTRIGKGGVPFVFYKFRSMYCNVENTIHREFVTRLIKGDHQRITQQDSANSYYKLKSDPRVTRVGKIIRKTSIDELPQLFCVLKGHMSLVGPRPPLPYEVKEYQPWHLRRVLGIKPGITGLWQVNGRSKVCFDDMVRMDLRYVRNCSLTFDLKILIRTLVVVLKCEGAS